MKTIQHVLGRLADSVVCAHQFQIQLLDRAPVVHSKITQGRDGWLRKAGRWLKLFCLSVVGDGLSQAQSIVSSRQLLVSR